jgi:hypothetical protein
MSESNQIFRLVYASRATFKAFVNADSNPGSVAKLDENVAEILKTARRENQKNHLVGALYYGHGYFFQCLEGTQFEIDQLYEKLLKDPRHTDLKILSKHAIDKIGFSSWEMKFAAIDQEVRSFLRSHNMGTFNPYKFDLAMTNTLVELLHNADEEASNDTIEHILEEKNPSLGAENPKINSEVIVIGIIILAMLIFTLYFYFN